MPYPVQEKEQQKAVKAKREQKHKLSFTDDEEGAEGGEGAQDRDAGQAPSTSVSGHGI